MNRNPQTPDTYYTIARQELEEFMHRLFAGMTFTDDVKFHIGRTMDRQLLDIRKGGDVHVPINEPSGKMPLQRDWSIGPDNVIVMEDVVSDIPRPHGKVVGQIDPCGAEYFTDAGCFSFDTQTRIVRHVIDPLELHLAAQHLDELVS